MMIAAAHRLERSSIQRYAGLLARIASDAVLGQAHAWICRQRRDYSPNSDVWDLRWRWDEIRLRLQRKLLAGTFRFGAVRHRCVRGELIELWSAEDAIVLKALALVLTEAWAPRLSPRCHHLPGNGGVKGALREVRDGIPGHRFVFRTDVKEYYAHIDHERLYAQLERWTDDRQVLRLLWGCLHRHVETGGIYRTIRRGISRGCPLSPLFGALYLNELDERMAATGLGYARFMDDWVILAPTRWKLRKAIKRVHQTMAELGLSLHPDKTSVGRTERGFDFLGYRLGGARVEVARPAVERMAERVTRLYEQGASERRIGDYVRRWLGWVNGGWVEPRARKTTVGAAGTGGSGRDGGERIGELGWRKCPIKGRATNGLSGFLLEAPPDGSRWGRTGMALAGPVEGRSCVEKPYSVTVPVDPPTLMQDCAKDIGCIGLNGVSPFVAHFWYRNCLSGATPDLNPPSPTYHALKTPRRGLCCCASSPRPSRERHQR